jgi:hypothetical protein
MEPFLVGVITGYMLGVGVVFVLIPRIARWYMRRVAVAEAENILRSTGKAHT